MEKNSVLFLDPSQNKFFKYDLKSNLITPAETITNANKDRIDQEIEKLNFLKGFEATDWRFDSEEAQNYRRRAIWQYLLHPDCSSTPSFISSKELGSAFAEVTEIRLSIDVSDYLIQGRDSDFNDFEDFEEKASVVLKQTSKRVVIQSSLVSDAQETIKKLKEKLQIDLNLEISAKNPQNTLALKVLGRRDYLSGPLGFIFYRSVREKLRGLQELELKLAEIPKKGREDFPQFIADDEENLKISSFLMFYASAENQASPMLSAPRIIALKSHKPLKERLQKTAQLLAGLKHESKTFTGEVDWPFRIQVLGLEDFFKVFIEAFEGNALKNGTEQPAYLLDPCKKSVDKKHSKATKKNVEERRQSIILIKSKSRALTKCSSISQSLSNYSNHCTSNSTPNELANKFNLPFAPYLLSFDLMLIYGDQIVENCKIQSEYCPFSFNARLSSWVNFPIKLSHLPKETRLGINIFAVSKAGETFLLACAVKSIFNETGVLRMGKIPLKVWPFYRVEHRLACMQEFWGESKYEVEYPGSLDYKLKYLSNARLFIQFDCYNDQPVWSLKEETCLKSVFACKSSKAVKLCVKPNAAKTTHPKLASEPRSKLSVPESIKLDECDKEDKELLNDKPQIEDLANLEQILLKDPLESLSREERRVLVICRDHYCSVPMTLQLFLRAVNWTRPMQVREAHKMLGKWKKMSFEDMLSLLNAEYADEQVRLYCVQHISQISDEDFALYMPQLVQALCLEPCHFSALGELLIERALQNPQIVGHSFFWALRGQLHVKATAERFGLILEQFLMLCGNFRDQLLSEVNFVRFLQDLGDKLSSTKDFEEREKSLKGLLIESVSFPGSCTLPIDCGLETDGVVASRCKVMNSKKMPLWMEMKSFGEGEIPVIFKVGDDLRQDILTLQMIKVMDTIWLDNGLDLRIRTYRVVVTGDQSGMIECVRNSMTTSDIQTKYGGMLGALRKCTILDYIKECNPTKQLQDLAIDNFVRSCAGYCVASYILGIADRHNGNIMITNTGHLFHIDFGHFLGNFKTKFGIQRERSNFVLTVEMAHAMGGIDGELFKQFRKYCHSAYNLVRKHGRRLINFFKLMISAGMPELQDQKEIEYIRDMLSLKLTDSEADDKFNEEIDTALNNTFRRVDNLIHNLRRN